MFDLFSRLSFWYSSFSKRPLPSPSHPTALFLSFKHSHKFQHAAVHVPSVEGRVYIQAFVLRHCVRVRGEWSAEELCVVCKWLCTCKYHYRYSPWLTVVLLLNPNVGEPAAISVFPNPVPLPPRFYGLVYIFLC